MKESATSTYIVLKELAGNPPPQLNALQSFLAPHAESIRIFWICLWLATALFMLGFLLREYLRHRRGHD